MNTYQQELPIKDSPAFVGFYESNHISPVSQDISDIHKHFQRRDSLSRNGRLMSSLIEHREILQAILKRDPQEAELAMRKHLARGLEATK